MKLNSLPSLSKLIDKLKKGGAALVAVILLGALLLILPGGGDKKQSASQTASPPEEGAFSLPETESRIADALSEIHGAGRVTVVLTLKSSAETVIAVDTKTADKTRDGERDYEKSTSAVIVGGSSAQSPVTLKRVYPEFLGALIVAEGADRAEVRLDILSAVSGLTGLGTDKITVTKMKNS
jgi:stage III sporulation protein AG